MGLASGVTPATRIDSSEDEEAGGIPVEGRCGAKDTKFLRSCELRGGGGDRGRGNAVPSNVQNYVGI